MNSIIKRGFVFILCFMFIFTLIPAQVFANEFSYTQIIEPIYEDARTFSEGLAAVKKDGKWGYIDTSGNTVIQFNYDLAYSFSENKGLVGNISTYKDEYSEYQVMYWGLVDRQGKYIPLTRADGTEFFTYYDEYMPITESRQLLYNGILMLYDDFWTITFGPDGKEVNFGNFSALYAPTEGIVPVYKEATDFVGYIDQKTGNRLFEDKYFAAVRPFNQGLAFVVFYDEYTYDENWSIMDTSGKVLVRDRFSNFYVKNIYKDYRVFNDNSLASVEVGGKWGAIDKSGKTVIPFDYDRLYPFTEGVAGFLKDGKFGFVDVNGKVVIPPQFDDVSSFNNGIAVARIGDNAFCIDKLGQKISGTEKLPVDSYFVENGYNDDGSINYTIYSPGRYVVFEENGKYGFGEIKYTPTLPTAEDMDSWALEEVLLAIENNLVPVNLQNMYRTDTTRIDFAALVVRAIEEIAGKDIDDVVKEKTGASLYELVSKYPFKDTTDKNVIAAQALGIINGRGEGIFAPYDTITRQDAATLLMRTAKFLGQEATSETRTFNDQDNIAGYAQEAVNYVAGLGIMNGKANNNFAPTDSYNREQAYMTMYRLFNVIMNK